MFFFLLLDLGLASGDRPLAIHRTLNAEQPTLQWLVRIIAVRNRAAPSQFVSVTGNNGKKKVHFVAASCNSVRTFAGFT